MWLINDVQALKKLVHEDNTAEKVLSKQVHQVDKVLPFVLGSAIFSGVIFYTMLELTFNLSPYQHALSFIWFIYHTSAISLCWYLWQKILQRRHYLTGQYLKTMFIKLCLFFTIAGAVGLISLVLMSSTHNHQHSILNIANVIESLYGIVWLLYHIVILYVCVASWNMIKNIISDRQIDDATEPLPAPIDSLTATTAPILFSSAHQSDYLANYAAYSVLLICALLSGCLWALGIAKVIITNIESFTQIIVLIGLHFGMLSGAMSSIGVFRWVYMAFAVPSLLTWSITLIYIDEPRLTILAVAVITLVVTSSYFAKYNWLNSVGTIRVYLENTLLVSQLKIKSIEVEAVSMAKTNFLASASHDLRQPVHALSLFIETLSGTQLDDHQQKIVAYAKTASQSSRDMLNSILDYSHLESGEMIPNLVSTELDPIIQDLVDEFGVQSHIKNLTLRYHPTIACVKSDPAMLSLILRNFLSNALRYTRTGGVLIGARLLKATDAHNSAKMCRISVWDTGSGLKPEEMELIFDSFQQLERHNVTNQGLGLGLSIAKGLAQLLNVHIGVKSVFGRGSQFFIDLPICTKEAEALTVQAIAENNKFCDMSVLVVDDEETVLTSVKLLLESWGYYVETAYTINEAVACFKQQQPDMVITDFQLANRETGEGVIVAIRELTQRTVPFILLTGHTAPNLVQIKYITHLTVLHKPIDPRILLAALQSTAAAILKNPQSNDYAMNTPLNNNF